MQPGNGISKNLQTSLVLIWLVMTLSVVIYFGIIQVLGPELVGVDQNQGSLLETVLLGIAIGITGASFPIRNSMLNRARAAARQETIEQLSGDAPREVSRALRISALILPLAMCEVPAVLGVVVYFLNGSDRYTLFLGIALVGMLLHFPRKEESL